MSKSLPYPNSLPPSFPYAKIAMRGVSQWRCFMRCQTQRPAMLSTASARALKSSATSSTVRRPCTSRAKVRNTSAWWARRNTLSKLSSSSSWVEVNASNRTESSLSNATATKRSASNASVANSSITPGWRIKYRAGHRANPSNCTSCSCTRGRSANKAMWLSRRSMGVIQSHQRKAASSLIRDSCSHCWVRCKSLINLCKASSRMPLTAGSSTHAATLSRNFSCKCGIRLGKSKNALVMAGAVCVALSEWSE